MIRQEAPRTKGLDIRTVSHTLSNEVMEKLRNFAFFERVSESAVIEFALREMFDSAPPATLSAKLKAAGASLRRRATSITSEAEETDSAL